MKYSLHIQTRIGDWPIVKELEDLGYDACWFPDTQMMWSDCYATMAAAALNTTRIKIGTGVAIPGTRIAPTTAHSIASINVLAPGRVFLGIGTGHTAMRVMGQDPMPIREFREYLRVVRAMLKGEEVEYEFRDRTTAIRWQEHADGFRNIEVPIPIYVAANGPLALKTAGRYGDGLISIFNEQKDVLEFNLRHVQEGADKAGRSMENFHCATLTTAVVLRPGEKLTDERVIETAGSWVAVAIHFVYEVWRYTKDDSVVPDYMKSIWEQYVDHVADLGVPEEKCHQVLHEGHCSYYPKSERKFITPEMIEGACMVGGPSEIAEQIREAEKFGLDEVSLLPPLAHIREVAKDFAEQVIPLV
ncbi:MAG TPA: LLM class flavin-dependent oxidoreductase [Gammaproteobacteria bacterium]|nr:LLM class flavin-dependent oxidoreductase [Gammaproteobacteria bacterium]